MIALRNKISGLIIAFLLAGLVSQGQVLIRATLDRDNILVGEPVKVSIEARMPLGEKVNWFSLDSIPHMEWIEKGMPQETNGVDGKVILQTLTLTSYDTGHWIIPRYSIKVGNKSYSSDTTGLRVDYAPGFNSEENYRDIKETEDVQVINTNTKRWLIYAGAGLLLILLVYLFMRKKKPVVAAKQVARLTPFEEAQRALAALRKERPADALEIKNFYTKLNDVFRDFLVKQFSVSALEKTNEEVIVQLKQLDLPPDQLAKTGEALRLADFVKFARYQPAQADHEKAITVIESAIRSLNKSA